MPQPAFSVRPASWTLSRMPSIESSIVPDTVQLIVEVAGLCSSAPALLVMRPAGIAPRRSAQTKRSFQYFCSSSVGSASDSALATRWYVPSMSASTASPDLVLRRYFLSQMSCDAGCIGISLSRLVSVMPDMSVLTASRRTVLIPILLLSFVARVVPAPLLCWFFISLSRARRPKSRRRRRQRLRHPRRASMGCHVSSGPVCPRHRRSPAAPTVATLQARQTPCAWVPADIDHKILWRRRGFKLTPAGGAVNGVFDGR